jgi:hypothetical protein
METDAGQVRAVKSKRMTLLRTQMTLKSERECEREFGESTSRTVRATSSK